MFSLLLLFRLTRGMRLLMLAAFLTLIPATTYADEYGVRWTPEQKNELSWKYFQHIVEEHQQRQAKLEKLFPELAPKLNFSNLPTTADPRIGRYLKARLSRPEQETLNQSIRKIVLENQKLLVEAEKKALPKWNAALEDDQALPARREKTVRILGDQVTATNLGVILDTSPSMRHRLDSLRAEITENFRYAYFAEVATCWLYGVWEDEHFTNPRYTISSELKVDKRSIGDPPIATWSWFHADPPAHLNPFDPKWHCPLSSANFLENEYSHLNWVRATRHPASGIFALSHLLEVDTIYWFSDYKDRCDKEYVGKVVENLRARKIRLYLTSIKRKPHKLLVAYAKESGGAFKRER